MGVITSGPGNVPVDVSGPKLWPPSVTPDVALTPGAVRVSSDPRGGAPGSVNSTLCEATVSLLISTARVTWSAPVVAQILTGPAGAATFSSRAPGGKACENMSRP